MRGCDVRVACRGRHPVKTSYDWHKCQREVMRRDCFSEFADLTAGWYRCMLTLLIGQTHLEVDPDYELIYRISCVFSSNSTREFTEGGRS